MIKILKQNFHLIKKQNNFYLILVERFQCEVLLLCLLAKAFTLGSFDSLSQ